MKINAQQAVDTFGDKLIGIQVITQKEGGWPGGLCEITDLGTDENAPEIVLNVKRLLKRTKEMDDFEIDDECGVFNYEEIEILNANRLARKHQINVNG